MFWRKVLVICAQHRLRPQRRGLARLLCHHPKQDALGGARHTAAEIVFKRADASKPNMGLTSWANAEAGGKPRKADATIAKNYLAHEEIDPLNRIVNFYLEFAELQALGRKPMYMTDWINKLDEFLRLTEREVLSGAGSVSHDKAE